LGSLGVFCAGTTSSYFCCLWFSLLVMELSVAMGRACVENGHGEVEHHYPG
jgi:hypothetical protein